MKRMANMRILVTGANGYLGSGIVRSLINAGANIIATDFIDTNIDPRAEVITGDLFDLSDPYEKLGAPDVLLHLAWRDGFVHNSDSHIDDLCKHYHFINKMMDGGVKRVCIMGSMHEIGFYEGAIKEETPCNPMSMYGIAKNALRQMIQMRAEQCGVIFQWLRGFYIVSNTLAGNSIFSKICRAEQEGKTLFPFTSGQNQYDFLDYDVFCKQVSEAVIQEKIAGIINICSGHPEKLADRVERFIKENGFQIKLDYGKFPDRPYDSKAVWGDDCKIRKIMSNKQE